MDYTYLFFPLIAIGVFSLNVVLVKMITKDIWGVELLDFSRVFGWLVDKGLFEKKTEEFEWSDLR